MSEYLGAAERRRYVFLLLVQKALLIKGSPRIVIKSAFPDDVQL